MWAERAMELAVGGDGAMMFVNVRVERLLSVDESKCFTCQSKRES